MHSNINQVCTSYELVHTKGVAVQKKIHKVYINKRNRKLRTKEHYESLLNDALKELYGDKNE